MYKPYPKYRRSNVLWIRDIPEHWSIKKVKHLADFYTGWTPPSGNDEYYDGEYPWANISDLGAKYLKTPAKTITQEAVELLRMRLSKKGSLLFSFKLSIGLVSLLTKDMYTNEAIATFPPNDRINTQYLYFLAPVAIPMNAGINIYNAPMLNQESIKNALLVYPPIAEQQAIAAFLDQETARIDTLIQKQERMIELLKEKRIALITQAVTKGLDPTVKMKDSGIEWLGEVPEHWEVKRLKYLANVQTGYTPSKNDEDNYDDEGTLWVKPDDLNEFNSIEMTNESISEKGIIPNRLIKPFSALVCCIGSIGKFGVSRQTVITNQQINSITFIKQIDKLYGLYAISVSGEEHQRLANRNVVSILNSEIQKNISFVLPNMAEQQAIASFLDRETENIDSLIQKRERAIELLREYRASLIHHAVTGKIDLRDYDVPTQ